MSSNLNKKNNDQKNYNFVYSPINITNKIVLKKDNPNLENPKSNEQFTKYYYTNISSQNKTHNKNTNSLSNKDKQKVPVSPNNQFFYKSKIQKESSTNTNVNNTNLSKNFNETKNSEQNTRSPISLTGRITNLHNIKLNKEKIDEEKKKYKGSNINLNNNNNDNKLIKSTNILSHNSKSVNNNNKNKNLKYGNNLIIKTGNLNEGLNNLKKENIYGNGKKNSYNFNNNNHGIINNMNNNTSKNKKKNEVSNSSNLNLGMLSFSTSNISVNNVMSVNNHNLNNNNDSNKNNNINNDINNNINIIKNTNISEEQKNKNNLNLCLNGISSSNKDKDKEKNSNMITNAEQNKNSNRNNNTQTKSAEQTTRNPKYFKNESIYNTNYIINFIDSNYIKNGKIITSNKTDNKKIIENSQIYVIGQKNSVNYKELTDLTNNNVNEILSKKNIQKNSFDINKKEEKKNCDSEYTGNSFIKQYFNINDGQKYKNPEELHFSMVKIYQNINKLKGKF